MRIFVIACSAVIGAAVFCAPIAGQAKTAKECRAEWQANKAANQAKKITEKAYVKECEAGAASAQPAPAAATTKAAAAKSAKECRAEWQANKAAYQAKKITEKAYVKQCEAGTASAPPASAPARQTETKTAPAPAASTRTEQKMAPPAAAPPARSASVATGNYQYTTEVQAKARCGSGTVVWANLESKIYHFAGHKDYGKTKSGAYMCERDATSEGMRAAKNEKHP